MQTLRFGMGQKMKITEPLDTWLTAGLRDFAVPEAVGSSARVFSLDYAPMAGEYKDDPAIKIMRPDKTHYALPLFRNEVRILTRMKGVPGVTPLIGLGFMKFDAGHWPHELAPLTTTTLEKASASHLSGETQLFTMIEAETFLDELDARVEDNWLAFLILPRRWEDNLYLRCDAGYTRGEFHRSFSVNEALKAALQICEILNQAHENNVIFLDHKALHYYWNQLRQQVYVIDWNIGRIIESENVQEVYAFDVLQFSARALHHLLTGRQAPGSVTVGPNKPEDIQGAPRTYEPQWTYDDQKRLTDAELDVLGGAIQGQYKTITALAKDLQTLFDRRQSQS